MKQHALQSDAPAAFTGRFSWAGYLLGFGLGGFFDGILLHQVLQWHHLLSALEGEAFRDLRVQVLADGLFHMAMYVIAAAGLWMLWKTRREFAGAGADRWMLANTLIGFGVWHIVDSILSHWVLGIHRIRMDSPNPLLWDLIWFAAFGVAFIAAGGLLRRGAGPGDRLGGGRRLALPVALTLIVLITGPVAALPPPNVTTAMVLFRPGISASEVFAAAAAVDGRVVWSDASGGLWAIDLQDTAKARTLYAHGALFVSNGLIPAGCFAWSRA
ncbi:DUF2243 domain-containing protein [Roseomonas genomospecies 6]|uniref:DUF2243 domain-containing protein n=1 Tax=Roseomonas genomospecies 6 TaxID=214106 RepID=A0A9W7TYF1_9PROT|nr:DUF2243 domain-containing protein [Roseomonas genomospecies 6]KAA0679519.1 DUF2243 domain-containing protein [Roseomonas genomospecies 6]